MFMVLKKGNFDFQTIFLKAHKVATPNLNSDPIYEAVKSSKMLLINDFTIYSI